MSLTPQIPCSNRFEVLSDAEQPEPGSESQVQYKVADRKMLESKRVSERYTAAKYPLSRKHKKRQMMNRRKGKSRNRKMKTNNCSRLNDLPVDNVVEVGTVP